MRQPAYIHLPRGLRTKQDETCKAVRRACCVQCSLPCVAVEDRGATHTYLPAAGNGDILLKLHLQKRLKNFVIRRGKHLDCLIEGRRGIAVRTKWQSGIGMGDLPTRPLKGNRPSGNGGQAAGKSSQT